jgi:hypothetical protein
MMRWRLYADAVVLGHAAYVAFVIFGFVAILVGAALDARWVRNFWFRILHLAAIGVVLVEALLGVVCPLTWLEDTLRVRAGQAGYPSDFIAYWTHRLIFFAWPPWVFVALYAGFTIAVAVAFWLVPPQARCRPRK